MKQSIGIRDRLFGKPIVLENQNGEKIVVTQKWIDKHMQTGDVKQTVDALVFDPLGLFSDVEGKEDPLQVLNAIDNPTGSKIRTEQVVIGIQISQEAYDKFFDHDTNLLYIFVHRNEGIVQRLTMPKETWKNLVSVNT